GRGIKRKLEPEKRPGLGETYAGKVREVTWRQLPERAPYRGLLRLGELVRPSQQVCVLARTWVRAEAETEALLFTGVRGEMKIWHDGESLFQTKKEHSFEPESFAVPITLHEGWNEITLKAGTGDMRLEFAARLAERENGRPLHLEDSATPPEGVEPAKLSAKKPRTSGTDARPGAWASVKDAEDAEGLYRRSLMEWLFEMMPNSERPGAETATAAAALAPTNLKLLWHKAMTRRPTTAVSAEVDINPWLHTLDEIRAVRSDLPAEWMARAIHEYRNKDANAKALEITDQLLELRPEHIQAASLRAAILENEGQEAIAASRMRELATNPKLLYYPNLAASVWPTLPLSDPMRGRIMHALAAEYEDSEALYRIAWDRRLKEGEHDPADWLDQLSFRRKSRPWSVAVMYPTAVQLLDNGHPERALDLVQEGLKLAPEEPELHKLKARALLTQGKTELAVASLETALELDFSDTDDERLLEFLRDSGTEAFHEEFRLPLDTILGRTEGVNADTGVSREILSRQLVVEVNPDGTANRYRRLVQRVLNEKGARDLDRVPFWTNGDQDLRVLKADVRRADGTLDPARTGRGPSLFIDLPPLEPGDIVDLEWRIDDLRPTFFGNYFGLSESFTPDLTLPVAESEIVVIVPQELPLRFHTKNLEGGFASEHLEEALPDGRTRHTFRAKGIEPMRGETLMPPLEEIAPTVQASSYESWEEMGAWWWNLIEEEIRSSPEMREKVVELTEGKATPEEKLRAIYDFVVTDIRYNAWEFGVHGYQPYSAEVIFSRGFGDCKDKAILMRAMLAEADIEAYPVLIRAEGRRPDEDHELALVEHFNHCIAYIPEQEGLDAQFLDGTARHHPLEVLPNMDRGAKVLVVKPDGVEQKVISFPRSEENRVVREVEVDLIEETGAAVTLTRRSSGSSDPEDRGRFSAGDEERQERAEALFARRFGSAVGPVSYETSEVENLETPVQIVLRGRPESFGKEIKGGRELPSCLQQMNLLQSLAGEPTRTTDLLLDVPRSVQTKMIYQIGENARGRS
ncbi:MAG: DUF3857 domain-containing protein, partial [Planctomycetota bacterium]